jgi:hypothetical protein
MSRSCLNNPKSLGQIYFAAGPDIIECRVYYSHIAEALGVDLTIREIPLEEHLRAHPETIHICTHRVYTMQKARDHNLVLPSTPLREGLHIHVKSLLTDHPKTS